MQSSKFLKSSEINEINRMLSPSFASLSRLESKIQIFNQTIKNCDLQSKKPA